MLLYYHCNICNKDLKRILDQPEPQICCETEMERSPKPMTSRVTEVLDNGIMAHQIERLVDADNIFKERSDNHNRESKIIKDDKII